MQPFATTTELLSHQSAAVAKMRPTRIGALFMEQGTGKSRTAIELAKIRAPKIDRVIWFAPVSLLGTIYGEIRKHTDCALGAIYLFDDRTNEKTVSRNASWYLVGIESMSASIRRVLAAQALITDQTMVILDESTYCKGPAALRTRRITLFAEKAKYRLAMTGTPMTQGVVDLYAQLRFLSPSILGYTSFYSFAANHLEYSEKFPGLIVRAHNTAYLAAKMEPYVYQITKAECLTLPPKVYAPTVYTAMTWEQRAAYEGAKERAWDAMDRDDRWDSWILFRLFTELQQIVSGFQMIDHAPVSLPSERLTALCETIAEAPEAKTIIWAKYRYDVAQITQALQRAYGSEAVVALEGRTRPQDREMAVERFRHTARYLVATQSVGGHGFTINEADRVIFYSNGFKYSERLQAEDRCHRYGQTKTIPYTDIHCTNSIDDRILSALSAKQSVVNAFRKELDQLQRDGKRTAIAAL